MAGLSKTYSGDFTSFFAGKILGAAGLAKGEKDRRVAEGLEKARSGSLFAKALQHEFGGDLYNRTLGNFDPRKKFSETDRKSSKEGRFAGQFPEGKGKGGSTVDKKIESAENELLKEDDSIPVKDEKLRTQVSKFLGKEIATKMNVVNFATNEVVKEVKGVRADLDKTHTLISQQTDLMSEKFDVILGIFDANLAYQKKIAEEAKVRRRESELEIEKDLSTTRKLKEFASGKKGGSNLLTGILGDLLKKFLKKKTKGLTSLLFNALKGKSAPIRSIVGSFIKAIFQGKTPFGKATIARRIDKKFKKNLVSSLQKFNDYGRGSAEQIATKLVKDPKGAAALADFANTNTNIKAQKSGKDLLQSLLKDEAAERVSGVVPQKVTDANVGRRAAKKFQETAFSGRAGIKATNKAAEKLTGKVAGKTASKSFKFIPGVGTGISIVEAGYRASQGDTMGALLSLGSAIPFVGWGFVAADIARDLGYDPLNTLPAGYETGTGLSKKGPAVLHGTEMVIGSKDREDALNSYSESVKKQTDMLVSSALSLGTASGFGPEVNAEIKKLGVKYTFVRLPVDTDIGTARVVKTPVESPLIRLFDLNTADEESEEEEDDETPEITDVSPMAGAPPVVPSTPFVAPPDGSYASGTWIGPPTDADKQQTGLNMNLPGGIGTPIYAPIDLIYRSVGTDGKPAVGLDGTPDVKGPAGVGFGYYGAYYFEKDGKEYEVLLAHFRDLPYKGSAEGEKIPKGTLLGYQGASGRSKSRTGGVYPHISLHVNGIGHFAGTDVLQWFAHGLATGKSSSGPGASGYGNGGERETAFHELAKDEALSSLTPGVNDYVKPGGRSVISNTPWESITDDTMLYVYADSKGVPTIGYGSAAMRGITFKTTPITVRQAKAWLKDDINRISTNLSKNIKWWDSLTASQRAGLIMFEYNAGEGNSYISSKGYPSLVRALEEGNIRAAIEEIQRDGPAQTRIELERELLRSGPQQIVGPKIVGPKTVGEGKVGSGIPFFPDLTIMKGIKDGLESNRERERNSELLKLFPILNNKSNDLQSNSSLAEDLEEEMEVIVQTIIVNNNTSVLASASTGITSNTNTNSNSLKDYQMTVLGS